MPLDPRVRRFLDLLAASNPPTALTLSPAARREALAQLMGFSGPGARVGAVEDMSIPGAGGALDVRLYRPLEATPAPGPGLVYLHGGGLVAGSLDTHDWISRALASAGQCTVMAVDYRLGPEHRFPAALEDAVTAVRYAIANAAELQIDPNRIGIAGDSAGGSIAGCACQLLVGDGAPRLAVQVLLCPILDYAASTPSRRELASGYLIDDETLAHDLRYYLPAGVDATDPRVSPLRAGAFAGLPPTLIHTAEFDPLRDEGHAYSQQLTAAGVKVRYTCHPGMIHLFYGLGAVIPYARTMYEQLTNELRPLLH